MEASEGDWVVVVAAIGVMLDEARSVFSKQTIKTIISQHVQEK